MILYVLSTWKRCKHQIKKYFHWTKERGFCLLSSEDQHTPHTHTLDFTLPFSFRLLRAVDSSGYRRAAGVRDWAWCLNVSASGVDIQVVTFENLISDLIPQHLHLISPSPGPSPFLSPLRWDETDEKHIGIGLCQIRAAKQQSFAAIQRLHPVYHSRLPCHLDVVPISRCEHAKLGLPSPLHSGMFSEILNYIHETPEQTSACAPQCPYSNKIQFYPCAERLDSNRPASSRVTHTNTYLNTLDPVSKLSFCLAQLLLDVVIGIFSPALFSVVVFRGDRIPLQ